MTEQEEKDLKKLRTKCKRWYGSIMRSDRFTWTLLLDSNFSWFSVRVKNRMKNQELGYGQCIDEADKEELKKLFKEIEEYRIGQYLKINR